MPENGLKRYQEYAAERARCFELFKIIKNGLNLDDLNRLYDESRESLYSVKNSADYDYGEEYEILRHNEKKNLINQVFASRKIIKSIIEQQEIAQNANDRACEITNKAKDKLFNVLIALSHINNKYKDSEYMNIIHNLSDVRVLFSWIIENVNSIQSYNLKITHSKNMIALFDKSKDKEIIDKLNKDIKDCETKLKESCEKINAYKKQFITHTKELKGLKGLNDLGKDYLKGLGKLLEKHLESYIDSKEIKIDDFKAALTELVKVHENPSEFKMLTTDLCRDFVEYLNYKNNSLSLKKAALIANHKTTYKIAKITTVDSEITNAINSISMPSPNFQRSNQERRLESNGFTRNSVSSYNSNSNRVQKPISKWKKFFGCCMPKFKKSSTSL
ncbi:MAG: hypothetical protein K5769_04305 [Pseudobutyrivibrio sp.]|nr:hypothetical protein [Pseudobutyrivibrio sp.]